MQIKKYYTISEAAKELNIAQHVLRYVEKHLPKMKLYILNGRRYYTLENIQTIKNYIAKPMNYSDLMLKIDYLEQRSMKIMKIINPVIKIYSDAK